MNTRGSLAGKIVLVCLCLGIIFFFAQESVAQFDGISISLSGGVGNLPLKDWKNFFSELTPSHFEKDKFGTYADFRLVLHFSDKHGLAVNLEKINLSASKYDVMIYTSEIGEGTKCAPLLLVWDFETIPIGLSYEFYPRSTKEAICPFFGIGGSYFFSEVAGRLTYLYNSPFPDPTTKSSRDGEGYGLHVYTGLQTELTDKLMLITRLRGRYADGMAFTDNKEDAKVEFTGVDLTLGLGWRF